MSGEEVVAVARPVAAAGIPGKPMDIMSALQLVLIAYKEANIT
jgi:hypothetical protein